MVLCEDSDCSVCFSAYSRMDRIPRVLHCRHTFCEPCLQTLSQPSGELLTVGCPLCRRVTCIRRGLSLQEALWVDGRLWDQIPEDEDELKDSEDERTGPRGQTCQAECSSSSSRTRIKFRSFFRKFSLMKQPQERIVTGCNVEMKSWRRLSAEETS